MSVLVLATESPVPAHGGYPLRVLHQARALAAGGVGPVTVLALGEVPHRPDEPFVLVGVEHRPARLGVLARSLRRPYLAAWCASRRLDRRVVEGGWSLVLASSPFLVDAARRAGAPVLLDAHNVEHEVASTLAASDPSRLRRLRWRWEAAKIQRAERRAAADADAVTTPSEHDAAAYRSFGGDPVEVAPNGVDVGAWAWQPPSAGSLVGYVGSYAYRPNEAAALELVEQVLPALAAVRPDVQVRLIGRAPTAAMRALGSDQVQLTGEVDALAPHLQALRALVVPLRAGGGTRLKLLEAFAAGVPVVSTPLGAAGLEVHAGEHLLLAESPAELAEATRRVLDDDALALDLSRAARALVEERYDWSRTLAPLVARATTLAGRHGADR